MFFTFDRGEIIIITVSSISFSYYYCMMDLSNCLGVMGVSITMIHSRIVSPENSNH